MFTDFLDVVWALRWVLTAVAVLTRGGFYADTVHRVRQLEAKAARQARTIYLLRLACAARRARRPIISGRVVS